MSAFRLFQQVHVHQRTGQFAMVKQPLRKPPHGQPPDSGAAGSSSTSSILDNVPTAWLNRGLQLDAVIILAGLGLCLFMHQQSWRLLGGVVALVCCLDSLLTIRVLDRRDEG